VLFLHEITNNSLEEIITIHNDVLYAKYKESKQNDFTVTQFGLYIHRVPGITKIKGSDGIWAKKINCKIVKEWLATIN
jgi:hypothetical protein